MRCHDRNDDHRGPITWNAADAMLINYDRRVPAKLRSCLGHRMRKRDHLVARHETGGADQKRGNLHVGIAIVREVIHDGADFGRAQRKSMDFRTHSVQALRRDRRRHRHKGSCGLGEPPECRFREAQVTGPHQRVVIRD